MAAITVTCMSGFSGPGLIGSDYPQESVRLISFKGTPSEPIRRYEKLRREIRPCPIRFPNTADFLPYPEKGLHGIGIGTIRDRTNTVIGYLYTVLREWGRIRAAKIFPNEAMFPRFR